MLIPDGPPHICWGVAPPGFSSNHRLGVGRKLRDGSDVDLPCDPVLLGLSPPIG